MRRYLGEVAFRHREANALLDTTIMVIASLTLVYPSVSQAQWAVYDKSVQEQAQKLNQVKALEGKSFTKLDGDFKGYKDMEGVQLQYLDVKFDELNTLTDADKLKFIGTEAGCGDPKGNSSHYRACMGLRNLRIQTLKQGQAILVNLDKRRKQIADLIEGSRNVKNEDGAGVLARYQFELQGLQALMQADAMQLHVLMDGYRERAKLYEQQQMEARASATGSGASSKGSHAKAPRFNLLPQ